MALHRTCFTLLSAACLLAPLAACDDDDGGGPTADVVSDVSPDADDVEDVAPHEPLALEAAVITTECTEICTDIEGSCESLGDLGADVAACVSLCEERAGEDGYWLGNYGCMSDSCDAAVCFAGDAPVSPHAECEAVCPLLDDCDVLDVVELPEDQPGVCRALCAGAVEADEDLESGLACARAGLADGCDDATQVVESCLVDLCPAICEEFLTPAGDESCGPAEPIFDTWADTDACEAACGELAADQKPRLFGCLMANDCGDPAPCLDLPEEDEAACADGCVSLFDLCEGAVDDIPTAGLCAGFCTGLLVALGSPDTDEDAGACVAAAGECPAGDAAFQTLLACVMQASEACETVCGAIATCNPNDEAAEQECLVGCAQAEVESPALVAGVRQCVEDAAGDCPAIEACIPED